jgi:hypothetical protein
LGSASNRTAADKLLLLSPDAEAPGEDPRRPGARQLMGGVSANVSGPAHDGGVAVAGQRDGPALAGISNRPFTNQLIALLGPATVAAGENPRRPDAVVTRTVWVVCESAYDGGVAVAGQRDGDALAGVSTTSSKTLACR